jgi:hypothetical protein
MREKDKGGSMSPQSEEQKNQWGITGVAIPAGLFVGMGIGFLVDNIAAGIFIGLGSGFLIMLIGMLILQFRR